ncbi:MAG: RNA methyltransferase [Clostridiales bacterium]|nr:RNA methyltransferase [Clostridiales bacterium]
MMLRIESLANERVKQWKKLSGHAREEAGRHLFLVEGEHMTEEALKSRNAVEIAVCDEKAGRYEALLNEAGQQDVKVFSITSAITDAVCSSKTPQGIFCVCSIPETATGACRRAVALEGVQDPGNVGTILRTMDAAGFDLLIIDRRCANPYSAKALQATMGAIFRIPVRICDDLCNELDTMKREQGLHIMAGDLKGKPLFNRGENADRICILIGNEGSGISERARSLADIPVRIPMPGKAESLNASVAAGILIYDVVRTDIMTGI